MKKFYLMAALVFGAGFSQAQNEVTVDFESLTLPTADTFYVFTDDYAPFTVNNVTFGAHLNSWGSSVGFVYSNMTDVTTAGYTNPNSAFAGEGADASANYAIYYGTDTLWMSEERVLVSADFTNTTYAGISMRDGDQFAKQFGSTTDANGDVDGTNGEDFFFVRVYGWDDNFDIVDSVDVYLADFRGADVDDYILNEWETFDLSDLSGSAALTFGFHSSDVGQFGMNTPAYFAMDNFKYLETNLGLSDLAKNSFDVYPNPSNGFVKFIGFEGNLTVYSASGSLVLKETVEENKTVDLNSLEKGIYILNIENEGAIASEKLIIQ